MKEIPIIYPAALDHLVFRVADMSKTEPFYTALLGPPATLAEGFALYTVGSTRLFFTTVAQPQSVPFDKDNIGLNHLAFAIPTLTELEAISTQLDAANIKHSGIAIDKHGNQQYIWLDDPDSQRIEFYLRPQQA